MQKHQQSDDTPLAPPAVFKQAVKAILSNSKKQSDADLAKFQAANLKKRKAKKDG